MWKASKVLHLKISTLLRLRCVEQQQITCEEKNSVIRHQDVEDWHILKLRVAD